MTRSRAGARPAPISIDAGPETAGESSCTWPARCGGPASTGCARARGSTTPSGARAARPARADLGGLNLAAKVEDGRQVLVPLRASRAGRRGRSGRPAAPRRRGGAGAPVNLNTATLEQLDALSGVGPATAQKILDYREEHGGFGASRSSARCPGIGDVRLAALRELVTGVSAPRARPASRRARAGARVQRCAAALARVRGHPWHASCSRPSRAALRSCRPAAAARRGARGRPCWPAARRWRSPSSIAVLRRRHGRAGAGRARRGAARPCSPAATIDATRDPARARADLARRQRGGARPPAPLDRARVARGAGRGDRRRALARSGAAPPGARVGRSCGCAASVAPLERFDDYQRAPRRARRARRPLVERDRARARRARRRARRGARARGRGLGARPRAARGRAAARHGPRARTRRSPRRVETTSAARVSRTCSRSAART